MTKIEVIKKYKKFELRSDEIFLLPNLASKEELIQFWKDIKDLKFPEWYGDTPWGNVATIACCVYLNVAAGRFADDEVKDVVEYYTHKRV